MCLILVFFKLVLGIVRVLKGNFGSKVEVVKLNGGLFFIVVIGFMREEIGNFEVFVMVLECRFFGCFEFKSGGMGV